MGTICSTARSVRVRESPGNTRCGPSPPRVPQGQRATGYTHRYTALHTKQEDKSLMVANPYAFTNIQTDLKEAEVNPHFIVTVDEPTKILSTQETELTVDVRRSITNAVVDTSPDEPQSDSLDTTEPMDKETGCKASEQQSVVTGTEPITNAVVDTSPDEPQPDTRETTDFINYKSEFKTIEQQPVITELEHPESTANTDSIQSESTTEPASPQPTGTTTEPTDSTTEPIGVTTQPTDIITEPTGTTTEPTGTTTEPTDITEPTDSTQPIDSTTEPTDIITEPTDSTQPIDSTTEPTDIITEPTDITEPTGTTTEHTGTTTEHTSSTTEPNQNRSSPGENTAPLETEEYFEDAIPKSPTTEASPVSTDAFDNTMDITTQANSTALGSDTFELSEKPTSPPATPDETTQGLETDLTNVTHELDEAATDIVESVLNRNIVQTPNPTSEMEGNVINEVTETTDLQLENNI